MTDAVQENPFKVRSLARYVHFHTEEQLRELGKQHYKDHYEKKVDHIHYDRTCFSRDAVE